LKIFIDDDDDDDGDNGDDDDDDDDDDVERTRTGPSAVRSDLEHQVNHNAQISNILPRFQLIRRRPANRRGQDEVFGRNYTFPGQMDMVKSTNPQASDASALSEGLPPL